MKSLVASLLKKSIFKESLIYGLSNLLYSGLPLLLLPFLIAILSPEDYGFVELFKSLCLVLTPILGFSTVQSISRLYFDLDESNFGKLCSTIIILHFFNAGVFILISCLSLYFFESKYSIIIGLSIVYFLFNQIAEILLVIFRLRKKVFNYFYFRLATVVLEILILVVLYVLLKNYDWTFRVFPVVFSTVSVGFLSLIVLFKKYNIKFEFNLELFKLAFKFSYPLIIHMISGYILNVGDRFIINQFLGEEAVGNYSVAYQIGMSISFIYTSFNLAWVPTFYEALKNNNFALIKKVRILIYILLPSIGIILYVIWICFYSYIPNISKYEISSKLIVIVLISYVLLSFYKFESGYFFYYKKTKTLAGLTLFSAIISIGLNYVFVIKFGIIGAAYTTLITFGCLLILSYFFKYKLLKKDD